MRTTIIWAAHPDDEVLYTGAYVAMCVTRGDRVVLAAVTDGEGSGAKPSSWTIDDLKRVRTAEQRAAWEYLVRTAAVDIRRLGQPDGSVSSSVVQVYASALEKIYAPDVEHYICGHAASAHPDHRAIVAGVRAAAVRVLRFTRAPDETAGGTTYTPTGANLTAVQLAVGAYRAFGQISVPGEFQALRSIGYVSRAFA
ncbi:PIG-L family deacetylase [Phycicoccus sp. SLBN-51]|uniref:PIG-L family deacetylase n=1 Tax=Phycicoccus sp. SLBN-51 TaxID=2768447 RepID=UPI00115239B7|nr:PIG-L family deacetylase [Phycicoccus sp. SLBN-51]TQJ49464.1 GlcNAc-PI de-N-acetylase [Phycicoccus sp. SLBN-51]